ncbi:MAG: rare lipoprotein [Acidobacteriaceae bacterium]|nr:rare lipoprotein [Acidobacteriaceae bacterium]
MSLTNTIRLAGSSVVALMMMSIPGITTPLSSTYTAPVSEQPIQKLPGVDAWTQNQTQSQPRRKKFSFLQRATFGVASWYGSVLDGHKTASGETFDMNDMTAAHRSLPFGTLVRVVDLHTRKSVVVRINDRGVLFPERVIDLSVGAAEKLGIRRSGIANVRLDVLSKKQAAEAEVDMAAAKLPEPQSTR